MRDDLNGSERRLIAALDRIDQFIDRVAQTGATSSDAPYAAPEGEAEARLQEISAENQRLSQELAVQHERQAETLATCEARLAEAHQRLVHAGQEIARLARANEVLATANRALIEDRSSDESQDDIRCALEAEIESLRAARDAERAQMDDIIGTLDRMIGTAPLPAASKWQDGPQEGSNLDEERG